MDRGKQNLNYLEIVKNVIYAHKSTFRYVKQDY